MLTAEARPLPGQLFQSDHLFLVNLFSFSFSCSQNCMAHSFTAHPETCGLVTKQPIQKNGLGWAAKVSSFVPTWSNSCLPVVLGWMANSSSASMVVTRTLTCKVMLQLFITHVNTHSGLSAKYNRDTLYNCSPCIAKHGKEMKNIKDPPPPPIFLK